MKIQLRIIHWLILVVILSPASSYAGQGGNQGGANVQITNLNDVSFGTWQGQTGTLTVSDDICVHVDDLVGQYKIVASGDGQGKNFALIGGGGETLDVTVLWNDQANSNIGNVELQRNSTLRNQTGAAQSGDADCSGGAVLNSRVELRVDGNALYGAIPGTYSTTISLEVEQD